MKLLKKFFSKICIFAIALFLQVGLVLATALYFESYLFAFQVASIVLAVLIFLSVVNKKESPEFKLPWLVLILLFPVFGTIIYIMFANSKISPRQFKIMVEAACRCKKFVEITPRENEEIRRVTGEYYGVETYLRKNAYSRGYLDNRVVYFSSGEKFFADLITELERAEKFIFMEYFIVDHGKLWDRIHELLIRKAAAGVEVRLMYDDIGTLGLLKFNYFKRLKKEGINCLKFNPFRPVVTGVHNNRDHRKITVIDGRVAYTGGANIGDEYANEAGKLGYWKDSAVKVCGSAVRAFTVMFLELFDATAKSFSDYEKYLGATFEKYEDGGCVHPFGAGPKPFYKELVGENNYMNIINSAKNYLFISSPYLIPDYNLITALRNAAFRGVDVRIVTPHKPDKRIIFNMTRSNYKYLLQAGVKIYEYTPGFIHAKGMIADGEIACVGTINLDYRSLVHHYECGAVLYKTPCIADIRADFDKIFGVSEEITPEKCKMGFFASLINAVLNLFSPML